MPGPTRKNSRQPPWEQGADADPVSFGHWLRRQRELRQISLREIADVTKISIRYLEALEQDRFDVLPAPVFARGFLREYARYVGLDPDEVVNSYISAQQALEPEEEEAEPPAPRRDPFEWTSALLLAIAVLALLAVVAVLGFYFERSRDERPQELPAIAAPVVEAAPKPEPPPETVPAAPAAPLVVTMDFTEDCWVEAVVDGRQRLTELHVQGESLRIEADEKVVLTLGNADGVRVEVNGRPFSVGAGPGRIARDIEIDLATARRLESPDETDGDLPGPTPGAD